MLSRERLAQQRVKCSTSELLYITIPALQRRRVHDARSIQNLISFVRRNIRVRFQRAKISMNNSHVKYVNLRIKECANQYPKPQSIQSPKGRTSESEVQGRRLI